MQFLSAGRLEAETCKFQGKPARFGERYNSLIHEHDDIASFWFPHEGNFPSA